MCAWSLLFVRVKEGDTINRQGPTCKRMKDELPDWVTSETDEGGDGPPETVVVFEGSPSEGDEAPGPSEQIYVQAGGPYSAPGIMPATNATVALVLSILGVLLCCLLLPVSLLLANGALSITNQNQGHPDQGVAKAAQIVSWVGIGIYGVLLLIYGGIVMALVLGGSAV